MAKKRRKSPSHRRPVPGDHLKPGGLRIIGGTFRGRRLQYGADARVRPMKDRVREAVFNLLGPSVVGRHVLDLFAGTGAIGLEAISRGASGATFVECHRPTARVLEANIAALAVQSACRVVVADTFAWMQQKPSLSQSPWVAFISPPYEFFVSRTDDMRRLIGALYEAAPPMSILVVESDQRFDSGQLSDICDWDIRNYPPARVALGQQTSSNM